MDKQKINEYNERILKCSDRICTLKLAIQGLVGHTSEYVVDKLVEIAKDIASENSLIQFYNEKIKELEGENE